MTTHSVYLVVYIFLRNQNRAIFLRTLSFPTFTLKNIKIAKYTLAILLPLLLIASIYLYPKYQRGMEIDALMQSSKYAHTFINMNKYFPVKEVKKGATPHIFPKGTPINLPNEFTYQGQTFNTNAYLDSSGTQGLLVIQKDSLVFEAYYDGQTETTQHISWSVSKSFISALFGIAIQEGHIKSIDQKVEEYLPELIGSGYEGVKIKDVLQMSTGVGFNEDYADFNSDINRWFRSFAFGDSQDAFAATLKREKEPGTYNHYVSINTHVLGMILVKTTGKSLTEYLQEKIWQKIGMEHDAYWVADNEGMEMALGGLNATLRDYAKMGQLFLHNGNWKGEQIVPAAWVKASITPDAPHLIPGNPNSADSSLGYGYQWWIPESTEGEFMAIGVFHQMIYINPTTQTVIVKNSANPRYLNYANVYANESVTLELFREIAHQGYN